MKKALIAVVILFILTFSIVIRESGKNIKELKVSVKCIECETRNTSFYLTVYSFYEGESIGIRILYNGSKEIEYADCANVQIINESAFRCYYKTEKLKKEGDYVIEVELIKFKDGSPTLNGKGKYVIKVKKSNISPSILENVAVYDTNTSVAQFYNFTVCGWRELSNITVYKCMLIKENNSVYTLRSFCTTQCNKNAQCLYDCLEDLLRERCIPEIYRPKENNKLIEVVYVYASSSEKCKKGDEYSSYFLREHSFLKMMSAFSLLVIGPVGSRYSFYLMDEWDNIYKELYLAGNETYYYILSPLFYPRLIFEIPKDVEPSYLLYAKRTSGLFLFIIPIKKEQILWAVKLS